MNVQIIVSRYNEDITWTKQFSNVIIYNKGECLDHREYSNTINLENVGREGHTYYKYIYDNYENLPDNIIFLQGNPFDHSPNIINNIKKFIKKEIDNEEFHFLSECIYECNLSGCRYHKPNEKQGWLPLPLKDVYEKLFNKKKENYSFAFGAGAQFIVSKKQILKREKEFYLKIIKMLDYSINPVEGYVIERFHKLIFS